MGVGIPVKRIILFLILFSSLVPSIGLKPSIFGFTWTLYRFVILICILIYFFLLKKYKVFFEKKTYACWICLLIAWIGYGIILLFSSPYSNSHKGTIELLSLFNGLISLLILISVIRDIEDINFIFNIIYYVYLLLVIIGLIEITIGVHFETSAFNDLTVDNYSNRNVATGIFYGENDFSTFLSCFAPIVLYKRKNYIGIMALMGTFYINYINDANICIMALIVGIAFYLLFINKQKKRSQSLLKLFILFVVLFLVILVIDSNDFLTEIPLLHVFKEQQINAEIGQGSLYSRMLLYLDSIKASINTYFLGVGPFGFSNYFYIHPSGSNLVNPHNYYLEILVEYGIVIFIAFCVCLFGTIYKLIKRINVTTSSDSKRKMIIGCEMLVLYSICCISPSSFINYSWQWIIISVAIIVLNVSFFDINKSIVIMRGKNNDV